MRDIEINKAMGRFGAEAIRRRRHGHDPLAIAGVWPRPGTARPWGLSGPRWSRASASKVIANETRPFLQGGASYGLRTAKDGSTSPPWPATTPWGIHEEEAWSRRWW
jgi:methylthioribose-1-phosphate isomerase